MSKRKLTEKQIAAIEFLALPKRGGMTYAEVAEKVGVDESTLYRWRQDEDFHAELNRRIVRSLTDRLPEMIDSIPDHVIKDGNAALFRTAMQALGLLTEKVELDSKSNTVDADAMKAKIARFRASGNRADDN